MSKKLLAGVFFSIVCSCSLFVYKKSFTSTSPKKNRTIDYVPLNTQAVLNYVSKYLSKDPVILEAGSCMGDDAVKMSTMWPESTVHAFEPVPRLFDMVQKNTKGIDRIKTYKLALSDKKGVAKFYTSEFEHANHPGGTGCSSSLLAPKEHLKYASHVSFKEVIEVPTLTLDEWAQEYKVKRIDFMWLDMQGTELNALKAGTNILKTTKVIYTEVELVEAYEGQYLYSDVKKWLEGQGFELVARDFHDRMWCGNAIFVRK